MIVVPPHWFTDGPLDLSRSQPWVSGHVRMTFDAWFAQRIAPSPSSLVGYCDLRWLGAEIDGELAGEGRWHLGSEYKHYWASVARGLVGSPMVVGMNLSEALEWQEGRRG